MLPSEDKARGAALTAALALAILTVPFGMALRLVLPGTAAGYYLGVMAEELVLWGLPGLALRQRAGEKPGHPAKVGAAAVLMGVAMQAAVAIVLTAWVPAEGPSVTLPQTAGEWALAVLALVIAPAVCEEAFFRGALFTALSRHWPMAAAVAVSTVSFALLHGAGSGLPGDLAVGLTACLLLLTTGRVWACMLFHMGYNGAALALAYCPRTDALTLLPLAWSIAAVWLASVIWMARRGTQAGKARVCAREGILAAALLAAAGLRCIL